MSVVQNVELEAPENLGPSASLARGGERQGADPCNASRGLPAGEACGKSADDGVRLQTGIGVGDEKSRDDLPQAFFLQRASSTDESLERLNCLC